MNSIPRVELSCIKATHKDRGLRSRTWVMCGSLVEEELSCTKATCRNQKVRAYVGVTYKSHVEGECELLEIICIYKWVELQQYRLFELNIGVN